MNITLIAAIGKNNELGASGDLIWKLKEDIQFFRKMTLNHIVVMGRKTFESLPKVLPDRKNIVLSNSKINNNKIEVYKSVKEFLTKYENYDEEIFIIGGATIYNQFIDLATKLYLTEIDEVKTSADVYFPKFDLNDWNRKILSSNEEEAIKYKHVLYKRKLK